MTAEKSLTKSQRRRRNERLKKAAYASWDLGPIPEHIRNRQNGSMESDLILIPPYQLQPHERAPAHMVEDGEFPSIKDEGVARLSKFAAEARMRDRRHKIAELRLKYPMFWGKRNGAKEIAKCESAEDPDDPLSESTVRKYFQSTKQ